ncbi:MAG TPA: histidine kinase, partial [Longimicrobium sp.]|nr:histidine kinase [Longimicrobium sp.]
MAERTGADPEGPPAGAPRRGPGGTPVGAGVPGTPGGERGSWVAGTPLLRPLLAVPLYYKILIANAVIVALAAGGGILLARDWLGTEPGTWTWPVALTVSGVGVLASVVVNGVILRLALQPLAELEQTAERVQSGELAARAPASALADRELEHLISTFNGMLEALAGYRQQLRRLAAQALGAEEEERKRIARELHDDTAQIMASLLIRLRVAQRTQDRAQRDAVLEDLREGLAQALDGVRRYARGLRPPALDELGLVPAIEAYAREVTESAGL